MSSDDLHVVWILDKLADVQTTHHRTWTHQLHHTVLGIHEQLVENVEQAARASTDQRRHAYGEKSSHRVGTAAVTAVRLMCVSEWKARHSPK